MSERKPKQRTLNPALRPRVCSIDDAAVYIGRSRAFVYDLMASGRVRSLKDGKRNLPLVEDLDKHLDSLPLAVVKPSHPDKSQSP